MIHLFLLDIDGVLVEPGGYFKALQDTVSHFSRLMGLGDQPPSEEDIQTFEANGLTSEWDSGAMCVAALLLQRFRHQPDPHLPDRWSEAQHLLAAHPVSLPKPDYAALACQVGEQIAAGMVPLKALQAVIHRQAQALLATKSPSPPGKDEKLRRLPRLPRGESKGRRAREPGRPFSKEGNPALLPLLDELTGQPHNFFRSPVTQYFQCLALGDEEVRRTYGVAPITKSPAYLLTYDRANLSASSRARLEEAIAAGRVRAALFTLRPSLPPAGVDVPLASYSPEAELARSLVGLEGCPLIGLGRMQWLAAQSGHATRDLIKPSPIQALAAIGAAFLGEETAALRAALALAQDGILEPPLAALRPEPVRLHIFEDSAVGVAAVRRAAELLSEAGIDCTCRCYGVVPSGGPKAEAMAAQKVTTYPSINEALTEALARAAGPTAPKIVGWAPTPGSADDSA